VTSQRTKTKLTKKCLTAATAITAFAVIGVAPSSAATQHHRRLFMMVPPQSQETGRDAALRASTSDALKWTDRDWETTKSAAFANCMTDHGQIP